MFPAAHLPRALYWKPLDEFRRSTPRRLFWQSADRAPCGGASTSWVKLMQEPFVSNLRHSPVPLDKGLATRTLVVRSRPHNSSEAPSTPESQLRTTAFFCHHGTTCSATVLCCLPNHSFLSSGHQKPCKTRFHSFSRRCGAPIGPEHKRSTLFSFPARKAAGRTDCARNAADLCSACGLSPIPLSAYQPSSIDIVLVVHPCALSCSPFLNQSFPVALAHLSKLQPREAFFPRFMPSFTLLLCVRRLLRLVKARRSDQSRSPPPMIAMRDPFITCKIARSRQRVSVPQV